MDNGPDYRGADRPVLTSVRRHYDQFAAALRQLEADVTPMLYEAKRDKQPQHNPGPDRGDSGRWIQRTRAGHAADADASVPGSVRKCGLHRSWRSRLSAAQGPEEVQELEQRINDDLSEYCQFAEDLGLHAACRSAIGPDVVLEATEICMQLSHEYPHIVFFAGKLIFSDEAEGYLGRFLHSHTALEVQRLLQVAGLSLVILPVRVTRPSEEGEDSTERASLGAANPALP